MAQIILHKKITARIANGHPWIYNNEIGSIQGIYHNGDIVEVFYHDLSFCGKGYINDNSQITVRLLTRKNELIDDQFFYERILKAWHYRQKLGYIENCRLVFSESDGLPGLIIDKFNDYFVLQTMSLGIDMWNEAIVSAIQKIFQPKGIYERNDIPVRELEGLEQKTGFLSEAFDTNIILQENGLQFHVDLKNGQKTGYFLDQHDNRKAIAPIVKDADVLGAFTYTGTFELHAAHYGARSVTGLDISENIVNQANANAKLNKLDTICQFYTVNAFDQLKTWSKENRLFDVVMLDPPSFSKSKSQIQKAMAGYKEINLRGLQLVRDGGFLVSSSITNSVTPHQFIETIEAAARDAKKRLRQVTFQTQAADHPIIPMIEHTSYLKFFIAEVTDI